jgi:hypothetical protein
MSTLRLAASHIPSSAISRVLAAASPPATTYIYPLQARALSAQGTVAVQKLRAALEEYRQQNYDREIPSRFKKEILKAATTTPAASAFTVSNTNTNDEVVAMDSLQRVLTNIGAENRLTRHEIQCIFEELGNGKEIPAQNMIKFI